MDETPFSKRRKAIISELSKDSIVIIPAAPELIRNGDVHFPYRQNSDFYYLTGFNEPNAIAVFIDKKFILFCQETNPKQELWLGPRAGLDGAKDSYGADEAYPIETFDEKLNELLANRRSIYYPLGHHHKLEEKITNYINNTAKKSRSGTSAPYEIINISHLTHPARLIKDEHEINNIRKACDISVEAHIKAMQACQPGMNECELEAIFMHEFYKQGARAYAYPSIVGTGGNACVLHYTKNNATIEKDHMILIDAAAEYNYYAADITRSFPADGHFSSEQQALYEIVLEAQLAGIDVLKPGTPWNTIQATIIKIITQGLLDLGILEGSHEDLIADKAYESFYMHNSGHWLGLDVHDAGPYKTDDEWLDLQPGMTLTVEPGIYIRASNDIDPKWHNMGIRIEDDLLITKDGHENLSAKAPKTIDDITRLMTSS